MATRQGTTPEKTTMRLTPHHPIESLPGFFCYYRQGHGGSCLQRWNYAELSSCVLQLRRQSPRGSVKFVDDMLHWRLAIAGSNLLKVVRHRKLQTQNA